MTATDIRIVLTRMNTFGDEIFGDPRVLRTYFYAIDDLAVGARFEKYLQKFYFCYTLCRVKLYQNKTVAE